MNVGGVVSGTNMPTRAGSRVRIGYVQCMFLDNSVLRLMMQMTIVQKVNVIPVLHGGVATIGTMNVGVVFVCMTHFICPLQVVKETKVLSPGTRQALRHVQVRSRSSERYDCQPSDKKCACLDDELRRCAPREAA